MAVELYFEHSETKNRYKVVRFNKEAGTVTLIGKHQREFDQKFDKEKFTEMGYTLKQGEAAPPPPGADAPPPPVAVVVDA